MSTELHTLVDRTISVASAAGSVALKGLGGHPRAKHKGLYDLQVDADLEAESSIVPRLRSLLPGREVASEELNLPVDWQNPNVWIVDPLDGSNNYYAAIPYMAVSIGLRMKQRLVLAVVHDPVLDQSFSACLGMGAKQEGLPLRARARNKLSGATVSLVTNYSSAGREVGQELYAKLNTVVRRVTTLWAPAADLVRVATGHIDGVVSINALYGDVCSGLLILSEAGGTILSPSGIDIDVVNLDPTQPISFIASVSRQLARELLDNLKSSIVNAARGSNVRKRGRHTECKLPPVENLQYEV